MQFDLASLMDRIRNPDIERRFLGTIILFNAVYSRVSWLRVDDFSDPVNGVVWQAMQSLREQDPEASIEPATLVVRLKHLEENAGDAGRLIANMASNGNIAMQAPDYARQIRDLSHRRRILETFHDALDGLGNLEQASDEVAASLVGDLQRHMGDGHNRSQLKSAVALDIAQDLERGLAHYTTGIDALDVAMGGGLYEEKLYGVGARMKAGKTLLLGSISHDLNQAGVKHLFIPMEMGSKEIEHRSIARDLGINAIQFLRRDDAGLKDRVEEYASSVPDNTVYEHMPGGTLLQIRAAISRGIVNHGIRGVILDYLQLVGGRRKGDTEEQHTREVAQSLADIARREGIFVLIAAQLNQDGNVRGGEGLKLACDQYYALHRHSNDQTHSKSSVWLE